MHNKDRRDLLRLHQQTAKVLPDPLCLFDNRCDAYWTGKVSQFDINTFIQSLNTLGTSFNQLIWTHSQPLSKRPLNQKNQHLPPLTIQYNPHDLYFLLPTNSHNQLISKLLTEIFLMPIILVTKQTNEQ